MKKILITLALSAFVYTTYAESITVSTGVRAGTITNLASVGAGGAAKLLSFWLTSATDNTGTLYFIDTPDGNPRYTNASYTQIAKAATNVVTWWTNFFGATNSITNVSLINVTSTVAGSTNFYPTMFTAVAATNTAVNYDPVNVWFTRGIYATNPGAADVQISLTFQK